MKTKWISWKTPGVAFSSLMRVMPSPLPVCVTMPTSNNPCLYQQFLAQPRFGHLPMIRKGSARSRNTTLSGTSAF